MEMSNKRSWAIAVVLSVLLPTAIWAGSQQFTSPSTIINCEAGGGCNITINSGSATVSSPEFSAPEEFGGTTGLDTLYLKGNLIVDKELQLTGGVTSTITGYVSSTSVVREAYSVYTSSASSQTLCALRNTGDLDRILTGVTLGYNTTSRTASTGQYFTISLSSTQGATGTGSNLLYDNQPLSLQNTVRQFTSTSTLSTATAVWRKGDFLNFLIASPTSTLEGNCRASYN